MNKIKCNSCKGTGNIRIYKHIEDGICFTCKGKGYYTVDNETFEKHINYQNKNSGIYFTFEDGKLINVVESKTIIDPPKRKNDNLVPEQFLINENTIYYRSQYNSFTKKSGVYSASFKHISKCNTLEVVTRLIKCNIKNKIELFKVFGETEEKLLELNKQLENAHIEAERQLQEIGTK